MALLHCGSALANVITASPPRNEILNSLPVSSSTKAPFWTKQTIPNRPRNLVLSPPRVAAPPTTESEQSIPEVEIEGESSYSKFSWRDHWYPVSLIEDLDPRLPTPFQLLGLEIVLWYDKSNSEWVAFDDNTPTVLPPYLKEELMKTATCSALIMAGFSIGVDPALGFLTLHPKFPKLALLDLLEHALQGSLQWRLRACSLFGPMRMAGRKQMPPSHHSN